MAEASSIRTFVGPHVELPLHGPFLSFKLPLCFYGTANRLYRLSLILEGLSHLFAVERLLLSVFSFSSPHEHPLQVVDVGACLLSGVVSYDSPDLVLDCPLCLPRARFTGQGA